MSEPRAGYPIECVAVTKGLAREAGAGADGKDIFHFFEVHLYDFEPNGTETESQLGSLSTVETHIVRNRFFEEVPIGSELTILFDHMGVGSIVVWDCNSG